MLLSGCYVPLQFDADVVINRTGHFEMAFDGDVVWSPLYDKLRRGELSRSEEREKVETIKKDLERDGAFSEIEYERQGTFKVRWRKAGDLLQSKMISFIRRNERLLTLKYLKDYGRDRLERHLAFRKTGATPFRQGTRHGRHGQGPNRRPSGPSQCHFGGTGRTHLVHLYLAAA